MKLLIGGPAILYAVMFTAGCVLPQMWTSYSCYACWLKWLSLVLFGYVATAFMVHVPWGKALAGTFVPHMVINREYLAALVAVLGTTISPYLFYWQASLESEEVRNDPDREPLKTAPEQARSAFTRIRIDTYLGMGFSNLIAYFIILTAAVGLHSIGVTHIETSADAAKALEPVAGRFASFLFAAGIIGTGLLAVPVLAGSVAYAVGETFRWKVGLEKKPRQAKGFYGVLAAVAVVGLLLNFTPIDPMKALYWAAIINGIAAVPVMVVMMLMTRNKAVMGQFTRISKPLRVMGWVTTVVMAAAAVGMIFG